MNMREMIDQLTKANRAYYYENRELMSNYEYDKLYDELVALEKKTGIIYGDSPTQNVGEHIYSELPKERHESEMLSLDKTKDPQMLQGWLGEHEGVLSWKLDGLTVVLTYEDGELKKAVTRGNGTIGEVVTENAKRFLNVPLKVPFNGKIILRGEAVISYKDFEVLQAEGDYKNARNLASASTRLLNSSLVAIRKVQYIVFEVISTALPTVTDRFKWISNLGFKTVDYEIVNKDSILPAIQQFANRIEENPIPTDGLVLTLNDVYYGRSLGSTGKFPRHSLAFKWKDEEATTVLREVIWQTSRTGIINPVAIFDTVELEGTEVSRATLNNISFIKQHQLGIGDEIDVIKANMIIPQIVTNHTKSNTLEIPDRCPACGAETVIRKDNASEILYCTNKRCAAKLINQLVHYCSRDAMNIVGVSEAKLEFLVDKGWVTCIADLYDLAKYRVPWSNCSGWTTKSIDKMLNAIEVSKETTAEQFLYAVGIPKIGVSQAKLLMKVFKDWFGFIGACESKCDFTKVEGFGEQLNENIYEWFENKYPELISVEKQLNFKSAVAEEESLPLKDKIFVITGKLHIYPTRKELAAFIESKGGTIGYHVTSNTDYLINNDNKSNSSKNKKAKELGTRIITEEEFQNLL